MRQPVYCDALRPRAVRIDPQYSLLGQDPARQEHGGRLAQQLRDLLLQERDLAATAVNVPVVLSDRLGQSSQDLTGRHLAMRQPARALSCGGLPPGPEIFGNIRRRGVHVSIFSDPATRFSDGYQTGVVTTCSPWTVLISTDFTWSIGSSTPPPKRLPSRADFSETTQLPAM